MNEALLHDDPSCATVRGNFPDIPIREVRDPVITDGLPTFASMTLEQKRVIIDELQASIIKSTEVAIDVNRCAHMMGHLLAMGDAQVSTGNEFRPKGQGRDDTRNPGRQRASSLGQDISDSVRIGFQTR